MKSQDQDQAKGGDLGAQSDYGIRCKRCGCPHLYVLWTKDTTMGRRMRRRACRNCGKRTTTYERQS